MPRRSSLPSAASSTFRWPRSYEPPVSATLRPFFTISAAAIGILLAFLEPYVAAIRTRRLELLERARAAPATDVRMVAEAMVRPIIELAQRGWRERAYLQVGSELSSYLDRLSPDVGDLLRQTAGDQVMALMVARCPPMPRDVWVERCAIAYPFIGRAAADRARLVDRPEHGDRAALPDDRFVQNLVDMFVGAMLAQTSEQVTASGSPGPIQVLAGDG